VELPVELAGPPGWRLDWLFCGLHNALLNMIDDVEKELGEGELVLRILVDGAGDAIYVKDRLGRYVFVNAAYARLLGRPANRVAGKEDFELFERDEAALMRATDHEIIQTAQPRTFEESLMRPEGIQVYQTTKTPYHGRAGEVIGVIGVSRNITAHKRVEQALRESQEWQHLAIEAAQLGVWYWGIAEDELVWTPRCRSMHGLGPDEEVTYARFLAILHPDDRAGTERAIGHALARCGDYQVEHRVVWPDGSLHWLSTSGRVLCDCTGVAGRMLGVAVDVTARKRADQERTELLCREQAARAEAQAATRAKDEFLAVLSHELRTPLQSMLGWTQVLRTPGVDALRMQKGLDSIERNVKMQAQLIEDLLDVSRIVAGKLRLSRDRVDLAFVVASALASVKMAADAKGVWTEATMEVLTGHVLGDAARLEQVVANLLSNAVKFTPNGGRIAVRLDRCGAEARITVADTGAGIAPGFLPHVFERFRQAEGTLQRSLGGLGLGLAIVRHLVELHGGAVNAESDGEGRGATFIVTLPLVD
jgi:PAS domain S-box-containing protein